MLDNDRKGDDSNKRQVKERKGFVSVADLNGLAEHGPWLKQKQTVYAPSTRHRINIIKLNGQ